MLPKLSKKKTKLKVRTSGNISDINYSNFLIKKKYVDLVCIGRKFISEPNFLIKNEIYKKRKKFNPKTIYKMLLSKKNNILNEGYKNKRFIEKGLGAFII